MKRASGVLMHISSLPGEYSVGSLGKSALDFVDFLADCGFSYWQTLPICLSDDYNSPYSSFSAFSLNPNFIDLPSLYEDGLLSAEELEGARQKTPYSCEFDRLRSERMALLSKAAKRYKDKDKIAAFLEANKKTEEFCRFIAIKEANGGLAFTEWQSEDYDPDVYETWCFSQYIFTEQWKRLREYATKKGVMLIGDIPIYVALDSSDVWSDPDDFLLGADMRPTMVAGVPPDYFSEDGQLWGNPLYDWAKMEKNGFAFWRERIAFMSKFFDGVRIDHFRGLESYYAIPADAKTARVGKWKKGPGIALIEALRDECPDTFLIAEDLGVITDDVRALVEKSGCPGMKVLQFGFMGEDNSPHQPHNYDNNCVAYTGTHDNNTLLGYVFEQSDDARRHLLEYCGYYYQGDDWRYGFDAILRTMFQSHAGLLILPIQDLLLYGCDTRLNRPGVPDGNWCFRVTENQMETIDKKKFLYWNKLYSRI